MVTSQRDLKLRYFVCVCVLHTYLLHTTDFSDFTPHAYTTCVLDLYTKGICAFLGGDTTCELDLYTKKRRMLSLFSFIIIQINLRGLLITTFQKYTLHILLS
jgi:hypothetical protein